MSHAHLVKCNGQKQGGQDKDASGQKRLLIGGSRFLLGQIVGIGPELFGSRSGRTIGILFILCKIRVFPRARQLFMGVDQQIKGAGIFGQAETAQDHWEHAADEEAVDEPVEEDLVLLEKNVGSSHGDPQDHVVFQIFD